MSKPDQRSLQETRQSFDRTGLLVLVTICLAMFSGGMNAMGLQPFLVEIGGDLDASVPAVGQAMTVTLLMSALSGLVAGPLADHFGHRRLMVAGVACLTISAMGTAFAMNYAVFMGARLFGGASLALLNGLSLAIAGSYFTGQARRRALSVTVAAMSGTAILGVPLLSWSGDVFGWRWAFGGLGVVAVLLIPPMRSLIPLTAPATAPFRPLQIFRAYLPLLQQRSVVALYIGSLIRAIFWLGILTYFGAYVIDQYDLSLQQVGIVYMVGGIGFLLGSLAGGNRFGGIDSRVLFVIVTILAAILFGLSYIAAPTAIWAVAFLTCGGFFGAIGWVGLNTMLANESHAGSGTTMSLNNAIFNLGSAIGGAIGGVFLAAGGYPMLGFVMPVFAVIASLLVWWSGRMIRPSASQQVDYHRVSSVSVEYSADRKRDGQVAPRESRLR